jgi:hypothetical protein
MKKKLKSNNSLHTYTYMEARPLWHFFSDITKAQRNAFIHAHTWTGLKQSAWRGGKLPCYKLGTEGSCTSWMEGRELQSRAGLVRGRTAPVRRGCCRCGEGRAGRCGSSDCGGGGTGTGGVEKSTGTGERRGRAGTMRRACRRYRRRHGGPSVAGCQHAELKYLTKCFEGSVFSWIQLWNWYLRSSHPPVPQRPGLTRHLLWSIYHLQCFNIHLDALSKFNTPFMPDYWANMYFKIKFNL